MHAVQIFTAYAMVADSPPRQVEESLWWVGESLLEIFLIYDRFTELKQLNQSFKGPI